MKTKMWDAFIIISFNFPMYAFHEFLYFMRFLWSPISSKQIHISAQMHPCKESEPDKAAVLCSSCVWSQEEVSTKWQQERMQEPSGRRNGRISTPWGQETVRVLARVKRERGGLESQRSALKPSGEKKGAIIAIVHNRPSALYNRSICTEAFSWRKCVTRAFLG